MSLRTGQKVVTRLRKYINGYATTEVKNNTSGDADYIAPFTDEESCPKYEIEKIVTPSPSPVGFDIVPAPIGVTRLRKYINGYATTEVALFALLALLEIYQKVSVEHMRLDIHINLINQE